MNPIPATDIKQFLSENFDFSQFNLLQMLCDLDLGVLMTDATGTMIFYNSVQANIDKMNPSDVLGRKISEVYKYHQDSSTCMRVLSHKKPIINYALSYETKNVNVGATNHSVFPLFKDGKIAGTICFVKDYNIIERNIPTFHNYFADEGSNGAKFTFDRIIGSAPLFVNAIKTAKMAGKSPSPVMLYGETGTGKELFAQAIHNFRYEAQKPYVDINCAAIPESLMEGLLFGTVKGAYTGAIDRSGLLESAHNGTIYLDEINSMPLSMQGKLLRVLQEKKIRRVGSLENKPLNCKVICSVNEEPRQLVKSGRFRMDLFYRLAVVYVHIPALRERLVDIEELSRFFLQKYTSMIGKRIKYIDADVIEFFWNYSWPGNVRELEHIIESAVNMASDKDEILKFEHCYFSNLLGTENLSQQSEFTTVCTPFAPPLANSSPPLKQTESLKIATQSLESERIIEALTSTEGNIAAAARKLSLSRQLLNYKINKLNLKSTLKDIRFKAFN